MKGLKWIAHLRRHGWTASIIELVIVVVVVIGILLALQVTNWKTLLAHYHASQLKTIELEDTTFLEMRESGDLGLLPMSPCASAWPITTG